MTKKKNKDYKDPLRHLHPASSVILSGYRSRLSEFSVKPPLFRTSTFEFPRAKDGEKFFQRAYHLPGDDGQDPGLIYSRLNNPSVEIVEDKLVAAERGASHALLFPSGMSAISTSVLALVPERGRILYSDPVYGGTYLFFREFCKNRFGIEAVPVDTSDLAAVERALRTQGPFQMLYLETPSNPTMKLTDIGACARLARRVCGNEVLVAVDNTFLGPVFQQPFAWGADLVLYSATKFLGGHSDIIAGAALTTRA
ncbi:MAG: PLP-dependent transferase, partial [Bdellovibrionales bacterium]|nr:PLP-dependent transferase [Bdellovibrionales bacterium]